MRLFGKKTNNGFVGTNNAGELNRGFAEFLGLAREVRALLDTDAPLLDEYLSYLFGTLGKISGTDAARRGFDVMGELIAMCGDVAGDYKIMLHPNYGRVQRYIDEHPLTEYPAEVRQAVYALSLWNKYLEDSAKRYRDELFDALDRGKKADLNFLSDNLYSRLGVFGGWKLRRLEECFKRRFLAVTAMDLFFAGANDRMVDLLNLRDDSSGKGMGFVLLERKEEQELTAVNT